MTLHTKRVALAAALAPLMVVVVCATWALWEFSTPERAARQGVRAWEYILIYCMYGIPTAYISLIVFLPAYYLVRHFRVASYWTMLAAGLVTCVPAALFYARPYYHHFVRILVFLLPFGATIAMSFLWIVRRSAESGKRE